MLKATDNELLTRTGPGTAMGEYFRRFWQPFALSRELPEPDCPPLRVKVLGEPPIAFRDTQGRHDVTGRCLELPNVPAGSAYHEKISIKAYPTASSARSSGPISGRASACRAICRRSSSRWFRLPIGT